ncbi:MAG: alpha-L-arabinofuranosidase [Thalassobius sp.]|nr:alpha-L-arabinofuranosidase [Thalassovita sp.]
MMFKKLDLYNSIMTNKLFLFTLFFSAVSFKLFSQEANITINTKELGASVSPSLHGIFFEEISHGGEGGLYAELIQNRGFEESRVPEGCSLDSGWIIPPRTPHFRTGKVIDWKMKFEPTNDWPAWSLSTSGKSEAEISLTQDQPLTKATPNSLQIDISSYDEQGRVAVVNEGFWGIKVENGATYNLSFYLRTDKKYKSPVTVSLETDEGAVLAKHTFNKVNSKNWQEHTCALKATASAAKAKFYITFEGEGTAWLDFVSLFPEKTFKNRPNGMRPDLAQYLADLKPAFVRWPGGCFVEGISVESAPNWQKSLGKLIDRPGTYSPWGYWSSDGIGYHEFLQFCEDIDADAMYVFNCGIACEMRAGPYLPEDHVPSIIENVLNGIEYAIGPADSEWGKVRVANGHPEPFPLKYIEVGNEQKGPEYGARFNTFYEAIKEKYPQLTIIASMGISHVDKATVESIDKMDMADEHAYKGIYWPMIYHDWYDKYERGDWKLYVGEYACNSGVGSGNMMAALNDATYILGMERNSDMITMTSYAPLLENMNDTDWPVNLIRFDNERSFARISYYAIQMLNENKATVNLDTKIDIKASEEVSASKFEGKIGLSTWDTYAEFKDIEVIQDGKTIYQSDFAKSADEWKTTGGNWEVKDGALAQTDYGVWPLAILKDQDYSAYTLKLKARRTGGYNAFMIPIAIKDHDNYLRAHIGAWLNRVAAFELVTNGTDAMVTQPVTLENPIETDKWYNVELQVNNGTIDCYLDGELLMTYKDPRRFFSIAGKDEATGEIVVKVVNASDSPYQTAINLEGVDTVNPVGKVITLSAESANDENSLDEPEKYVPVETVYKEFKPEFEMAFKPWSVTVLRISTK